MKITVITACYNSARTIGTAMESVRRQRGVRVEHIVVDGASNDGTVEMLRRRCEERPSQLTLDSGEISLRIASSGRESPIGEAHIAQQLATWDGLSSPRRDNDTGAIDDGGIVLRWQAISSDIEFRWRSERDRGMYDAINKGIKMATGEVVGILNADDVLESDDTLKKVAEAFERDPELMAVYGDIRFVRGGETLEAVRGAKTVRYCSAAKWRPWMFRFGAMAPHPSFYVRKEAFERLGGYSLDYRICADFELELRFLYLAKLKRAYLPGCMVTMRTGGASTAGWRANVEINREDLRALRSHGVWSCTAIIYLKYLFKIWGFLSRKRK